MRRVVSRRRGAAESRIAGLLPDRKKGQEARPRSIPRRFRNRASLARQRAAPQAFLTPAHYVGEAASAVLPWTVGCLSPSSLAHLRLRPRRVAADDESMSWVSLLAVVLLSWLAIALAVGTLVGHGATLGTGSDFE